MAALVGPLPTIHFHDGTRQAYTPPRNTVDLRYSMCTKHHPACDCREAEFAEDRSESSAERREAEQVFAQVLAGHQTFAYDSNGERDTFGECKCTGCEIARRTHFRASYHVYFERHEARRRNAGAGPFPF